MLNRSFDRGTYWIAKHPPIAAAVMALISLGALGGYFDPGWANRAWTSWVGTTSEVTVDESKESTPQRGVAVSGRRPSLQPNPDAIIVIETPDLFSQAGWDAYRAIVSDLEQLPFVDSVRTLDSVPPMNLFGLADPIFPRLPATPERFQRAKERALSHPFLVGQMISADGQTTLLMNPMPTVCKEYAKRPNERRLASQLQNLHLRSLGASRLSCRRFKAKTPIDSSIN
jgi:hypothetical protein